MLEVLVLLVVLVVLVVVLVAISRRGSCRELVVNMIVDEEDKVVLLNNKKFH